MSPRIFQTAKDRSPLPRPKLEEKKSQSSHSRRTPPLQIETIGLLDVGGNPILPLNAFSNGGIVFAFQRTINPPHRPYIDLTLFAEPWGKRSETVAP